MLLFIFISILGCVTTRRTVEGNTTYEGPGDAADARLLVDGDTVAKVLAMADGKTPVTVSTTFAEDGRRRLSASTTVTIGVPQQGRSYGSDGRPEYSSDYRARWLADQARLRQSAGNPAPAHAGVSGQASVSGIDPTAKCPEGKPTANWTQAQLDACQSKAIRAIVKTVGVGR